MSSVYSGGVGGFTPSKEESFIQRQEEGPYKRRTFTKKSGTPEAREYMKDTRAQAKRYKASANVKAPKALPGPKLGWGSKLGAVSGLVGAAMTAAPYIQATKDKPYKKGMLGLSGEDVRGGPEDGINVGGELLLPPRGVSSLTPDTPEGQYPGSGGNALDQAQVPTLPPTQPQAQAPTQAQSQPLPGSREYRKLPPAQRKRVDAAQSGPAAPRGSSRALNIYGRPVQDLGDGGVYKQFYGDKGESVEVIPWNGASSREALSRSMTKEQYLDYTGQMNVEYDAKGTPIRVPARINEDLGEEGINLRRREMAVAEMNARNKGTGTGTGSLKKLRADDDYVRDKMKTAFEGEHWPSGMKEFYSKDGEVSYDKLADDAMTAIAMNAKAFRDAEYPMDPAHWTPSQWRTAMPYLVNMVRQGTSGDYRQGNHKYMGWANDEKKGVWTPRLPTATAR